MKKVVEHISKTLKNLRKSRSWSLDVASRQTGVSKAMLGQIERGESSPTISTLWKIASGFEISFSALVEEPANTTIKRAERIETNNPKDDKFQVSPLFPYDKDLGFEVYIIDVSPGCEHLSPPHTGTVIEHVVVTEGTLEVLSDGTWHSLKKNEGIRFHANQPHGYRNVSSQKAVFHNLLHYPLKETQ